MSEVREFGFVCGELSMGQSNGFLFPRYEQSYIGRSLLPAGEASRRSLAPRPKIS